MAQSLTSLEDVLAALNNWFPVSAVRGHFEVSDGTLSVDGLQYGQYFRIVDSVFNDGLHQNPADDLRDEEFDGEVWFLAIPKAVENLADEIYAWRIAHPESVYTSESFGGYSYSKPVDSSGVPASWRKAFASRMARWRKI